ncbi:MAG: LacI family DNA-binding transcriptional regulator [Bacteroidota bacterium]
MKKFTIDDVAALAHVSRSVVSRVLNNHPNVSDAARERVQKVIREHNYRPSSVARSLASDRTYELCVMAPRRSNEVLSSGYWALTLLGISAGSLQRGYFASVSLVSPDMKEQIVDRITRHAFDGYIMIAHDVATIVADALQDSPKPLVLIGHDPEFPKLPSIDIDNWNGGYLAGRHLAQLGYTSIGVMLGPKAAKETNDRKAGFETALREAGLHIRREHQAYCHYSWETGYIVMQEWIASGHCPRAIFCTSDVKATGALRALYEAGLRVPEDVAVVGFDDLPASAYAVPPLTTVHQPIYEKGVRAAHILIDLVEGKPVPESHLSLPPHLVVRQTCGGAPGEAHPGATPAQDQTNA